MEFQVYDVALLPVIIALVQTAKQMGLPSRMAPLFSLILGIVSGFIYLSPGEPARAVFAGVVIGLSAVGLFSGTKNTVQR